MRIALVSTIRKTSAFKSSATIRNRRAPWEHDICSLNFFSKGRNHVMKKLVLVAVALVLILAVRASAVTVWYQPTP